MAKEPKQACPYPCPVCALYQAQEAFQEGIRECVPPAVGSHINQAGRELLLAIRALLDKGLETLAESPKPGSRRKAQRIKVE